MSETLDILQDFPAHTYEEWFAAAEKLLKGKPFERTLVKKTYEGIDIQPIYFLEDLDKLDHLEALPGEPDYVRGTSVDGATVNTWGIAQQITEAAAADFNAAARNDLSRGQNMLNMVVDRATRNGENPGDAADGDVGAGGVSIACTDDFTTALDDIDLTTIPFIIQSGYSGIGLVALFAAAMKKRGIDLKKLAGTFAADPIATLLEAGSLPISTAKAFDELAELTLWAKEEAPALRTIAVNGHLWQRSGSSAVEELGCSFAAGVEYIRELQQRGLEIDDIAPRMTFALSVGNDFFMEIAKYRAARLGWSQIIASFGGSDVSRKMHIHASTSTFNKTHVDPWVNMLRVSTEAFSAIAGSVDSLHVGPFDEIFRRPNSFSRRIARNVQIILRDEGHFDKVIDPAGGSWYVETITARLAEKAWESFQKIEEEGGMIAALGKGSPQEETAAIAAKRAKNIATRKDRIVGTSMYPNLAEKKEETDAFDYSAFKAQRSGEITAAGSAGKVTEAAAGSVVAAAVDAAAAGATLGDITAALHTGEKSDLSITPLTIHRAATPFETLRRTTEAYTEKHGTPPQIFMGNMGPIPRHKIRSDFSAAFLHTAAFETLGNDGFKTVDDAAEAAIASGAKAMVICSTDDDYPEIVPPLVAKVKAKVPDMMFILAGYPKDHVESLQEAGIDEFLHIRANALALLENVQKHLGVIS